MTVSEEALRKLRQNFQTKLSEIEAVAKEEGTVLYYSCPLTHTGTTLYPNIQSMLKEGYEDREIREYYGWNEDDFPMWVSSSQMC